MELQLPKGFRSWLQLWQKMEAEGHSEKENVSITPPIIPSPNNANRNVTVIRFRISDIKEMLLKELLRKNNNDSGFTIDELEKIHLDLKSSGFFLSPENRIIDDKIRKNLNHLWDARSEYEY